MTVRISVVIPTRNRPGPLAACLGALATSFPDDAETIVVSDGGSVDLAPSLEPFAGPLRLRLIATSHGGPAAARNVGLSAARGEIVAFTDDDCRPQAGWLEAIAAGVSASPPRAVGGTTRNGLESNLYAEASQLVLELLSLHDRARAGRERFLASNNVAFPASPLRQLGGFDESYRTAEDRELCRRWADAGFELGRVPAAEVEHDAELNLTRFARQFVAYGRGAARFHGSGRNPSLAESATFHLNLAWLAWPELVRRGPRRAVALTGLLLLWEVTNLAGYLGEAVRGRSAAVAVTKASARATSR